MDDFSPAAVARQVPPLAKLLEARQQLSNLLRYMDGKVAASDQIKALLADPQLMSALKDRLIERQTPTDKPNDRSVTRDRGSQWRQWQEQVSARPTRRSRRAIRTSSHRF